MYMFIKGNDFAMVCTAFWLDVGTVLMVLWYNEKQYIPHCRNSSKIQAKNSRTEAKSIKLTHIYMTDFSIYYQCITLIQCGISVKLKYYLWFKSSKLCWSKVHQSLCCTCCFGMSTLNKTYLILSYPQFASISYF
jgi:hypothetical protein